MNEEGRQIGGFVGPLLSYPAPTALPCDKARGERDGLPALPRGLGRNIEYQVAIGTRKLPKDNVAESHRPDLGQMLCAFQS